MDILQLNPRNVVNGILASRVQRQPDADFRALKDDIQFCGGNIIPIKVRPIEAQGRYEIVYGHRRHLACLELGLDVLSIVENITCDQMLSEMLRENMFRKEWSDYESSRWYERLLYQGFHPSVRRMSERLNLNSGRVEKVLKIARLPSFVLSAFSDPGEIKVAWAEKLMIKLRVHPDLILARSKELAALPKRLSAIKTFRKLTE
jgi:ParB family chromosome partitioning protein